MVFDLFSKQKSVIDHFFAEVDPAHAQLMVEKFLSCQGEIFLTGIGKSGFVAEKIATTLVATGSRASFMSPINALHGDIGRLGPNDLFVFLSKSGESEELLRLLPFVKAKKVETIAWVMNPQALLFKKCDIGILLPLKRELCPYDLSPTTSSVIQLIFGNIIAVALMEEKKFSREEFALNHPAGSIGKKLLLRVEDLMLKGDRLPIAKAEDRLQDLLIELSQKRCGCLLICEGGELKGIFTDGDLRRTLQEKGADCLSEPIIKFMTPSFISVSPKTLAVEALELMENERRVMMLPVVEANSLVGLIHLHDILQTGISLK